MYRSQCRNNPKSLKTFELKPGTLSLPQQLEKGTKQEALN